MSYEYRLPKRENAPVLVGLSGPSGSGKTFSAFRIARGLAGGEPFAVMDTENGRALHYAEAFPEMRHTHLRAPFTPESYTEAMEVADDAGFPVIVIDSASHMWDGEGGVLESQEEIFQRLGAREAIRMKSWNEAKKPHKRFRQKLLQVKAHVVLCFRAEDKIEMVKVDGKMEVRAKDTLTSILGWVPICERRLPFELTLSLLVLPSAPGVPKPIKLGDDFKPFFPLDAPISEQAGQRLAEWARGSSGSNGASQRTIGLDADAFDAKVDAAQIPAETIRELGHSMFPGKSKSRLTNAERGQLWQALASEVRA